MSRVITLGEILLRLTTPGRQRFTQAQSFVACYGGSEANAAVSLCNYGTSAEFVTCLPAHALGQAALDSLRARGIGTQYIVRSGERLGVYFVERGAGYRGQAIVYDRAGSAIAGASTDDFDWERIFTDSGAEWFHFSGVTPALSDTCAALCLDACTTAKRLGLTVSCDLNYRETLWSREKAGRIMAELCRYIDVCIAYEDEPGNIFDIRAPEGLSGTDAACTIARTLREHFNFSAVAVTVSRSLSATRRDWAAVLTDRRSDSCYVSRCYEFDAVDCIGGGDAFSGALIHALLNDLPMQHAVDFAAAAGCLKYTIEGDINAVTSDEVMMLAGIAE